MMIEKYLVWFFNLRLYNSLIVRNFVGVPVEPPLDLVLLSSARNSNVMGKYIIIIGYHSVHRYSGIVQNP